MPDEERHVQPSPEDGLEPVREQAHEETGLGERIAALAEAEAASARRVRELETREKDLLDRLARLQADFENFRRRAREEASAGQARGKEGLLKAMLPAIDNLDRALAHQQEEGLRLLARQLREVLESQGVTVLSPEGEAFDAKLHEAIASETREGVKAGLVLVVVEKGYALDGRVVRPARVIVAA